MVSRDLLKKATGLTAAFVAGLALAVGGCGEDSGGGATVTVTQTVTTGGTTNGTTTNGTTTNGTTTDNFTTEETTTEDTTTGETETD